MKATKEETYDHILTSSVINLEAPASSRIVVKPDHAGVALTTTKAADVVEWLELQKIAAAEGGGGSSEFVASDLITLSIGATNTVPLDDLGLPGARIEFLAEMFGEVLYVSDLVVNSGTDGSRIVHPLFVSWDGQTPVPDPADRFFDYDVNFPANEIHPIGGGIAAFTGFLPTNQLSIHFEVLAKHQAGGGGGGNNGGCRVPTSFTTNARQTMATNCASGNCHVTNASARGAMNLTGINDTSPAAQQTVCDQVLLRVNKDTPNMSGIFIAADPSSGTGHPFKFGGNQGNFTTFRNAVTVWINEEKTAP